MSAEMVFVFCLLRKAYVTQQHAFINQHEFLSLKLTEIIKHGMQALMTTDIPSMMKTCNALV
jgi:hypothetical protein